MFEPREEYRSVILSASKGKAIHPRIIHSLIEKESSYRVSAVSPTGVRGLCQLTRATAEETAKLSGIQLFRVNWLDPKVQIKLAVERLNWLASEVAKHYPNATQEQQLRITLHAYNAGLGAVQGAIKHGGYQGFVRFLPATTDHHYADKILKNTSWREEPTSWKWFPLFLDSLKD